MNEKFLKFYFENKLYLENPPLKMKDFINFCKKRGVKINKSTLEKLEKKGLFYPIFRCKAIYNEITKVYMAPSFSSLINENFIKLYHNNYIYIPKNHDFIEFKNFYDNENHECKIYSYYSSFQIFPLIFILKNEDIHENYIQKLDKFVNVLIATQIYAPYGRSNMRNYSLITNYEDYHQKLKDFNLNETLKIINANENDLYKTYAEICNKLKNLLGSDFAIQLWKSIDWKKKDKTIGSTRLGIEYLQWTMMLKRCIEEYLGREIFDVDEAPGDWEKIKYNIPSKENGRTLRGCRNENYTNKKTGKYEFNIKRKKSFYLANELTLDYHPKILLFVEGKTEKIMIPKFFEFCGFNHSNLGIEIIDIGGILHYYSPKTFIRGPNNKSIKSIVNNFKNLINFNLELWQSIPCFIGDNENDIINKLINGKTFDSNELIEQINLDKDEKISLKNNENLNESMVTGWKWIWDYDFEIDNFKPEEMHKAINDICKTKVSLDEVQSIYTSCKNGSKKGINDINSEIKNNKIEIDKKAFDYLITEYKRNPNVIGNRKIFEIIDKLINISLFNHSPVNTNHLQMNKQRLNLAIIKDYDIFERK